MPLEAPVTAQTLPLRVRLAPFACFAKIARERPVLGTRAGVRTLSQQKTKVLRSAWTRDHPEQPHEGGPPQARGPLSRRRCEPAAVLYLQSMSERVTPDPKVERVIAAGRARGIEVRPVQFGDETRTAEDAARNVGCTVAQIVKSLVFMAGDSPVLFLVSGTNRVDLTKGAAAAGTDSLAKADAAAARAATGFSIGATPPFGHSSEIAVFMDPDLLAFDEVWAAGGRPDTVFPVSPRRLQEATQAPVVDLKVS
jgi:prolyl-tRNA editing enzyme YbaK/EbsC (Cys-tRNA(Pro) deacylase)